MEIIKDLQREGNFFICWFTPQMDPMAEGWNPELLWSPAWVLGPNDLAILHVSPLSSPKQEAGS